MKKIAFMTVALSLLSGPALAQNQAALCKLWFTHKNVAKSATYQPGVDVHGRPVVPADGGMAAPIGMTDNIRIPVTVDLAQKLGAAVPAGTNLEAVAGVVNISAAGQVSFNGQDLTPATYALCTGQPAPAGMTAAAPAAPAMPAALPAPVVPSDTAPASAAGSLGTLPVQGQAYPAQPAAPVQTYAPAYAPAAPVPVAPPAPVVTPRTISAQTGELDSTYRPPAVIPVPEADAGETARPASIQATTPPTQNINNSDIIWGEGQ